MGLGPGDFPSRCLELALSCRKRSLVTDDESDSKRPKVGEDEDFDQVIADLVDVIDKESSSLGIDSFLSALT